jgi:glycosyltransferase involved in cell wall biosynthesis
LREVGADAAAYAPPGDVAQWIETVLALLRERTSGSKRWRSRRQAGIERAKNFSWRENARRIAELYRELVV